MKIVAQVIIGKIMKIKKVGKINIIKRQTFIKIIFAKTMIYLKITQKIQI